MDRHHKKETPEAVMVGNFGRHTLGIGEEISGRSDHSQSLSKAQDPLMAWYQCAAQSLAGKVAILRDAQRLASSPTRLGRLAKRIAGVQS